MIINGAWLVHASQTIADRSPAELVRASSSFMRDRPGKRFVLSRPMQKRFRTYDGALPKNARTRGSADYLVVLYSQIRSGQVGLREWPATSRGTYRVVGPLEVNFDYYPTWDGDDRVLFITPEEARRFGLARTDLAIAP
jgi:hypothetical protein